MLTEQVVNGPVSAAQHRLRRPPRRKSTGTLEPAGNGAGNEEKRGNRSKQESTSSWF